MWNWEKNRICFDCKQEWEFKRRFSSLLKGKRRPRTYSFGLFLFISYLEFTNLEGEKKRERWLADRGIHQQCESQ